MTYKQPYRVPPGKLILGIVLAIIVGALTPVITVLEMSLLMPVVVLSGLFMVFLFWYSGQITAWIYTILQLSTTGALLGTPFAMMMLTAGTIPALVCIRLIARKTPFFDQMKVMIGVCLGGMLLAVTIAYICFGGNMIQRMAEVLRKQFDMMPDAYFLPFVEMINAAIGSASLPGIKVMTIADYRAQVVGVLNLMSEIYQNSLPGALLSGAALTGVLSTLWGNWLTARRGLATNESYISPLEWFLPKNVTLGLTLTWVAAFILAQTEYAQGETVYYTVFSLASLAFFIQALGAVDRFFFRRGMPDGRRRFMLVLTLILGMLFRLFNTMLFAIGACSALFGSHGAVRRPPQRGNGDDSEF